MNHNQIIRSGTVAIVEGKSAEDCEDVMVVVPGRQNEDEDEEIDEQEFWVKAGYYSEVLEEIENQLGETPKGLWRGIWPLGEKDFIEGDRIRVQLPGMFTTKLRIGRETLEVFPESFGILYDELKTEYGWSDLVFTNQEGETITTEHQVEGETFRVREVIHRIRCNIIQFPGMTSWTTIYEQEGRKIERWIQEQVQVQWKFESSREAGYHVWKRLTPMKITKIHISVLICWKKCQKLARSTIRSPEPRLFSRNEKIRHSWHCSKERKMWKSCFSKKL
jgi:hypothetical protein